jgi:hypothetical protein
VASPRQIQQSKEAIAIAPLKNLQFSSEETSSDRMGADTKKRSYSESEFDSSSSVNQSFQLIQCDSFQINVPVA